MSWSAVIGHGLAHQAMGHGFGTIGTFASYATHSLAPYEAPSVEQLMDLAIRGWIGEGALRDGCLLHGVQCDTSRGAGTLGGDPGSDLNVVWKQAYYAKQTLPTEKEFLEIANRQFWTDGRVNDGLKRYGYYADSNRQFVTNLRYDIPGPADLVRFSVRHVWEPDLLAKIGYDTEFPGAIIDVWHAMKGLDYPLFTGPFASQIDQMTGRQGGAAELAARYAADGISEPTWARAYWWSHWVLPSPGQFFQALIRLDPARDRSWDSPEMEGLEFTLADYELGLRANDYPPKYRRMLAAINRPIVGVRFLRGLVDEGVYDYDAVVEWARRWGYSPRDQKDIADLVFIQSKGGVQKKAACKGCATCDAAFEVGIVGQGELEACYVGFGADPNEAQRMAALADLKLRVKRGREIVANVRKRFLRGSLTQQQARGLLSQWGIQGDRIEQYIRDWGLEFEAGRKELSAATAVKYACKLLIGIDDLRFRLQNLGYQQPDIDAMTREALACQANLVAEAAAKAARADRQQKADAYTAARRLRQSLVEAQRYLASHGTPKQLHDWFCSGTIGEPEVYSRLNALGWPNGDIGHFLSDCKSGKKPTGLYGGEPAVAPLVPPILPEATEIEGLP